MAAFVITQRSCADSCQDSAPQTRSVSMLPEHRCTLRSMLWYAATPSLAALIANNMHILRGRAMGLGLAFYLCCERTLRLCDEVLAAMLPH